MEMPPSAVWRFIEEKCIAENDESLAGIGSRKGMQEKGAKSLVRTLVEHQAVVPRLDHENSESDVTAHELATAEILPLEHLHGRIVRDRTRALQIPIGALEVP